MKTTKQIKWLTLVLTTLLAAPLTIRGQEPPARVDPSSVEEMVQQLKSKSIQTRIDAAYALSRINPPVTIAVPILIQALQDESRLVRAASAYTLSRIGTPPAKLALRQILPRLIDDLADRHGYENNHTKVRAATIVAVGAMGAAAKAATPILIQALSHEREDIRANAAVALGGIGQPVDIVIPALIQFTQRNDLARATGAYALSQIESPEAKTAVLEDPTPRG